MTFASIASRTVTGLNTPSVQVEVHLSKGMPALTIVGLAETAVRESKDRVRSAILNVGFDFPMQRLTINLAPADLPKDSARLDLPISIGILAASGQVATAILADTELVGELSLSGQLRPVSGMLAVARNLAHSGKTLIVPMQNASECAVVAGITVLGAEDLAAVCRHLDAAAGLGKTQDLLQPAQSAPPAHATYALDLSDVKGQYHAKRALEIAAAGGHSLLFSGPPGAGKTLMASRLPSILPPLTDGESLDVASVYSVADLPCAYGMRPFRQIHHTISAVALAGGGSRPKPGEISLAHHGVLFLDEMPEFDRKALEVLRQPIESGKIVVSRANAQVEFPADFQLVAAMNPCPCGYFGDSRCRCTAKDIAKYQGKISGPLLDRIDLHISVPALPLKDLQNTETGETSSMVRTRVIAARQIAMLRQGKPNAKLSPHELDAVASLDEAGITILTHAKTRLNLSARSYHRLLRIARTIADLANSPNIASQHLSESLSYR